MAGGQEGLGSMLNKPIKAWCEICQKAQEIYFPIKLRMDDDNDDAWNDMLCKECSFVIATLSCGDECDIVKAENE